GARTRSRIGILTFVSLRLMAWTVDTRRLFVVGDSISIQYGVYLARYLQGEVEYDRKRDNGGSPDDRVPDTQNGGDSGMVLAYLKTKLQDPGFKPDVLMLNCGLHDIRKNIRSQQHQVPIQEYENNLKAILKLVQDRGIRLIWVRTTEVIDSLHNAKEDLDFTRHASDIQTYNKVADKIFRKAGVPVIDL